MIDYRGMLQESAEPDYAKFSSKLVPGKEGIIGVRLPRIREISKAIIKDDWESFLKEEPSNFEEEMLRGFVIASAPMDVENRLEYTTDFLNIIDNWSTCDSFCAAWKFKKKDSEKVYDYFSSLIKTGDEYRMRVSVVFRMDHFLDEDHVGDILQDILDFKHEGYYYKMGAAWAVSFCFIKFPEITTTYLSSPKMDVWVCNKSIQKICESFRVSDERKAAVRALKRK